MNYRILFLSGLFLNLALTYTIDSPAAEEGVELVATVSADPLQQSHTTRDRLAKAPIALKNTGKNVVTPDTKWHNLADGSTLDASWRILQSGAGPDDKGTFTLDKDGLTTFIAEGNFEKAGTYVTALTVAPAGGGAAKRFTVSLTRTVAPVPDNLFATLNPARIPVAAFSVSIPPVPHFKTFQPVTMRVPVQNSGAEPTLLGTPTLVRFSMLDGDTEIPAALPNAPKVSAGSCVGELKPKGECAIEVSFPTGLSAGRYAANIVMSGPGGGRASTNVRADVRLSAWWAGILVGLGAVVGYLVVEWRQTGRVALDRGILVADTRTEILGLVEGARLEIIRTQAKRLLQTAWSLANAVNAGGDPSTGINDIKNRCEILGKSDQLLVDAGTVEPRELLEPITDRLRSELQSNQWTVENAKAAADRLDAELRAAPGLAKAAEKLRKALESVTPMRPSLADADRQALTDARNLLRQSLTPIGLDESKGGEPAARIRATRLNEAVSRLEALPTAALSFLQSKIDQALPEDREKLASLKARITELSNRDSIDPSAVKEIISEAIKLGILQPAIVHESVQEAQIPQLRAPASLEGLGPVIFEVNPKESSDRLRRRRLRWELVTNFAVLIGIGMSGVLALWALNSTWGSVTDIVTALLAGAGTRLAVGNLPKVQ